MKKLYLIIWLSIFPFTLTWASQVFVVKNIEFEGLQHISRATALSYLPIKSGETLRSSQTASILRSLYKTGFFDRITLSKEGSTLIIHVTERPTIGQLKLSGNSVIQTDKLTAVMRSMDIAEGRIYNPAVLEKIKQGLLNQYYQLGRYNARVDVTVTPMSRNRVLVKITISEGLIAKIRGISVLGNKAFSEKTLIKQLDITTSSIVTLITQSDRYSEEKLETSLTKLRNFYLDNGYLRMEVKSAQGQITPDRKSVYVTIVVEEGQPYTVKSYELTGQFVLPRKQLMEQIHIQAGETFSREKVLEAEKNITKLLGDKGYLFTTIAIRPKLNDKAHEIILVFEVKPGKRSYIRHITFSDNNRTNDVVLRREIEQWEAAPAAMSKLEESKHRLSLLPYIRDVEMSIKPVPETEDQVDVNYKVKEDSSAQATFKVGYSQLYHIILGAGLNQKNFMGTGNTVGINLSRSRYEQFYSIDYTDPYYTVDGISRSFNAAISRVDPGSAAKVNGAYTINEYDLGVLYGIPVAQEEGVINRILAGATYENTLVNLVPGKLSAQVNDFVTRNGRRFQELDMKVGYSRDSRDKAIFPTSGTIQTLFLDAYAPLASDSLTFYTLTYHAKAYQPLNDQFIILTRADLGYGNGLHGIGDFPFFRNYFAGGIDSVRGYEGYTLGPQDSLDNAYGGNMLADASLGLIFPNYISDNLRTSVFVDAGNVYTSLNNRGFGGSSTMSGPIRYSAGIEADWITPFGPIELSLAKPINPHKGDDEQWFQFALGANF
ncbi:MAG: outer membrane protein assembly factor BamA [Gammaproteobacteria bacterium RIFCSPHIGHO2_12_FULL_37_14]|nr:MAG: outer membrane protein assembly factor BamA [Gammaproteobacteria bacterium RIFCSPHIGHO2_12_FULL_37_14]